MIEFKLEGSNGNKFTISKGDVHYVVSCCKQSAGINWHKKEWVCDKCHNTLLQEDLKKRR